jgi:hypothetical protein
MRKQLFALLTALLSASCTLFTGHQNTPTAPSSTDISAFQKSFMASYYVERGGKPSGVAGGPRALTPFSVSSRESAGKATVPVSLLTTATFGSLAPLALDGYPELGQTSTFTAVPVTDAPTGTTVYDVTVVTAYPSTDIRSTYVEEYYVQDVGPNGSSQNSGFSPDGKWTNDDPIVKKTSGSWAAPDPVTGYLLQDQSARIKMRLTFSDNSTRDETIVSSTLSSSPGPKFAPAALDISGSLDLSQAFIPTPSSDPKVMYSSVVVYTCSPSKTYTYWFWQGSEADKIIGVRYYTEYADTSASKYYGYTASFEKTVGTLSTTGGSYASSMQTIFTGSKSDVLAESVLRQKVDFPLAGTASTGADYYRASGASTGLSTSMKTRVVNISGKKDFYLSQSDSDFVQLSSWATSTIYTPQGNADEILATSAGALALGRTQASTAATGGQPLVVQTIDPGLGELGTVYTAITTGAAPSTAANAPASNVLPAANTAYTFNGQQVMGAEINASTIPALTTSGTVEAWVYLNAITDTMGIVHKGTNVDFSDEAYSLQGWGTSGQIAMIVDRNGSYDAAYSDINLNTGKWYYIVGTWDVTGSNRYVRLYINGALHGSSSPSVIYNQGTTDSTSIGMMVGSQIPVSYNSAWGYFGVSGKILGVNVSQIAMSASDISTKYSANKGNTGSW